MTSRSAVTGRWILDGVDMRSPQGRRFRDLCCAFEKQIGRDLSATERTLVRQAAAMTLRAEAMQGALVRGDGVTIDDLIRLTSEIRRILAPIIAMAGRRTAGKPSALDEYLSREEAAP